VIVQCHTLEGAARVPASEYIVPPVPGLALPPVLGLEDLLPAVAGRSPCASPGCSRTEGSPCWAVLPGPKSADWISPVGGTHCSGSMTSTWAPEDASAPSPPPPSPARSATVAKRSPAPSASPWHWKQRETSELLRYEGQIDDLSKHDAPRSLLDSWGNQANDEATLGRGSEYSPTRRARPHMRRHCGKGSGCWKRGVARGHESRLESRETAP